MSFTLHLSEERLDEIVPILNDCTVRLENCKGIFEFKNRKLADVIKEIPSKQNEFDEMYVKLKAIQEWLSTLKNKKVAKAWKRYNEGYSRQLSQRDIQAYIAGEAAIVEIDQLIVEVEYLKDHAKIVVESIKQLGWTTANLVKLRVSDMQDSII